MSEKRVSLILRQLNLLLILLVLLTTVVSNREVGLCHCREIVYLERNKTGRIPCSCGNFDLVSWYTKGAFEVKESPFIYFDNVAKQGPGYTSGEYDIGINGSLIISNVATWIEKEYVVKFIQHDIGRTGTNDVHAVVIVPPVPAYPVVNGFSDQRLIYMDAERNGELTCSLRRVHPNVNLSWEVVDPSNSDKINILYNNMDSVPNEDGTFNVTLTSLYTADLFERSSVIQCKVTSQVSQYFPAVVTVGLNFPPVHPVPPLPFIDGCFSHPDHCVLEAERTGDLTCIVKDSPYEVELKWNLKADTSQYIYNEEPVFKNKSTSFDIFSIMLYNVKDQSSTKLTAQCEMINMDDGLLLGMATVSLLFREADCRNSLDHQNKRLNVAVLTLLIIFFAIHFVCIAGIAHWMKQGSYSL